MLWRRKNGDLRTEKGCVQGKERMCIGGGQDVHWLTRECGKAKMEQKAPLTSHPFSSFSSS